MHSLTWINSGLSWLKQKPKVIVVTYLWLSDFYFLL